MSIVFVPNIDYNITIATEKQQNRKRGDPMTQERIFELARLALIDRWAEASEVCNRYPDNWALKAKKKAIEKEIADLEEMKNK